MDSETSDLPVMTFSVLGPAAPVLAPRAGTLAIASRKTLSTPHYLPVTSRGVVPHISHDNVRKETAINGLYVGLEDCKCAIIHRPCSSLSNLIPRSYALCASTDIVCALGPDQLSKRNTVPRYSKSPSKQMSRHCENSCARPAICLWFSVRVGSPPSHARQ